MPQMVAWLASISDVAATVSDFNLCPHLNMSSYGSPSEPKTPKRRGLEHFDRPMKDSPSKIRSSQLRAYQQGNLDSKRSSVAEELQHAVPEISLRLFLEFLLPPLKDGLDVDKILDLLKDEGDSPINREGSAWNDFETRPSARKECEDAVFAPLGGIFEKICNLASRITDSEQMFDLSLRPNYTPWSERESTNRPDAYFTLRKPEWFAAKLAAAKQADDPIQMEELLLSWYDIGIPGEFKKDDNQDTRADDAIKLIFSLQQIMALDACRRFTFGFTIENISMRLWFCSRALVLVSEPFDFTRNLRIVTRIMLAFAFASKEELGWDTTIQAVVGNDGKRAYHIDIDGDKYETVQILSDIGADGLLSRATRVWIVRLIGTASLFVLKDIWVDDERSLEHTIHRMILDDIEVKFGTDGRNEAAAHLVTPVAHCLVHINGVLDHTTTVMMRGLLPPLDKKYCFKVKQQHKNDPGTTSVGIPLVLTSLRELKSRIQESQHIHRIHYRVTFEEIGDPIYKQVSLPRVFLILRDCTKVLRWMHESGWVHRDISAGNLFFYDGRGLIGDLEYAKLKGSFATHSMRTGNAYFIANEVLAGAYLYKSNTESSNSDSDQEGGATEPPSFFFNDLHDLESLLWVAVYELFTILDDSETTPVDELTEGEYFCREDAAILLFPGSNEMDFREDFMKDKHKFRSCISWIPESFEGIKGYLNILRRHLSRSYAKFERKLPRFQMEALKDSQVMFEDTFSTCMELALAMEQSSRRPVPSAARELQPEVAERARLTSTDTKPDFSRGSSENSKGSKRSGKRKLNEGDGTESGEKDLPQFINHRTDMVFKERINGAADVAFELQSVANKLQASLVCQNTLLYSWICSLRDYDGLYARHDVCLLYA
ncbi:hypothetical protein ACEPAI_2357 [Sanghuangporus weigelae]